MSRFEVEIKINMNNDGWGKYECENAVTEEIADLDNRLTNIINCNPQYGVIVTPPSELERSSLFAMARVVFDDSSDYFPGIMPDGHLIRYSYEDGPIVSTYEVHVKANDEADCMKVAHFMHYQLAGRQDYADGKIFFNIDDDKRGVLLIIDGDLCNRPLVVPIADDFIIKASELY